jgi:DNA-binding transcriptional ArsR family regulator
MAPCNPGGAGIVKKASKGYFVDGSIVQEHVPLFLALHRDMEHRIMELIVRRGPLEPGDLRRAMGISSQLLSYHMRNLKEAGALRKIGGIYELAFDMMEFQGIYQRLREEVLARLAMDAKREGISMEIERKEHFLLRIN